MDDDEILEGLRRVDETTLRFTPWGLGGRMEPSSSARFLSESLRYATLAEVVPVDLRLNFERVRKLFLYGLLEYEFFTAAHDLAHLALEGALRHRFVSYYDGEIPIRRDGVAAVLTATSFDDYRDALDVERGEGRKLRLRHQRDEGLPWSYPDLYAWARKRGLLVGQRNVGVFGSLVKLRNDAAHPEHYWLDTPPGAIRHLRDVAEIINRLWGHDTEGGRLFPTPIGRRPRAAALAPDRQAAVTFGSLSMVAIEPAKRGWSYALFLAADSEELIEFDWENPGGQRFLQTPGFQMTQYPAELLWGPGSQDELAAVLASFDDQTQTDTVAFLDRVFYIRVAEAAERPEFPRSAADVIALTLDDASAVWYVMRADFPMDAWTLVRDAAATLAPGSNHPGIVKRLVGDQRARSWAAKEQHQLRQGRS